TSIMTPPSRLKYQNPSGTTLRPCRSDMTHCRIKRPAKHAFAVRPKKVQAVGSPEDRFCRRLSKKLARIMADGTLVPRKEQGIAQTRNRTCTRSFRWFLPLSAVQPSTSHPCHSGIT